MGIYNIEPKDLIEPLETFLREQEGDVSANALVIAFNALSVKYGWNEFIKEITPDEK